MKYGYICNSGNEPSPQQELNALQQHGCKEIFKDVLTMLETTKRLALARCVKGLQKGDTLVVWKLDRLGSRLYEILRLLLDVRSLGVKFRCLDDRAAGKAVWRMVGRFIRADRRERKVRQKQLEFSAALSAALRSAGRLTPARQQKQYMKLLRLRSAFWLQYRHAHKVA